MFIKYYTDPGTPGGFGGGFAAGRPDDVPVKDRRLRLLKNEEFIPDKKLPPGGGTQWMSEAQDLFIVYDAGLLKPQLFVQVDSGIVVPVDPQT